MKIIHKTYICLMKVFKIVGAITLAFIVLIGLNYFWITEAGLKKIVSINSPSIKNRNILVLGAGREYRNGKHPNYFFNGRIQAVVALRKKHPLSRIIISGIADGKNYDEANDMKKELLLCGLKDTLIYLDQSSKDTYASLKMYNRKFLYEPTIIVSQKAHLCRILWMAQQMNIDALGFKATGWPKREPTWFLIREMGARVKATLEIFF